MLERWKPDSKSGPPVGVAQPGPVLSRASNGLDQFFASISDQSNLRILDLAGASQANVSFITSLGHRLYSDDILRAMDDAFGREGDSLVNQSDASLIDYFLHQTLEFPQGHFDGALVWDTLQFLAPRLLQLVLGRLFHILRPQAYLLAFFHAEEKASAIPVYGYRILDSKSLSLTPRGHRKPVQFFNNRSLEKLFQDYHSVKFFLTRDHLREVIVRR